jgi:uncharacterized protein YcbK (DUF882 family)
MGDITEHLSVWELECKCGQCKFLVNKHLILRLQEVRYAMDEPLIINSAYRCELYNERVGGSAKSYHTKGRAVDICTRGWTSQKRMRLLESALYHDFRGIGLARNYMHIDTRKGPTKLWGYFD